MAKSMRSKRVKRLRAIRREMVEPLYEQKDLAKFAAQEAALAAPKVPVRLSAKTTSSMDITLTAVANTTSNNMDVEMDGGDQIMDSLKPIGGVGKKFKRKFKVGKKGKRRGGNGKLRRRHI